MRDGGIEEKVISPSMETFRHQHSVTSRVFHTEIERIQLPKRNFTPLVIKLPLDYRKV